MAEKRPRGRPKKAPSTKPKRPRGRPRVNNIPDDYIMPDDLVVRGEWKSYQQAEFVQWTMDKVVVDGEKVWERTGEVLFAGAMGCAKSYALCLALLRYVSVPNTKVLLTRLTHKSLMNTTVKLLLEDQVEEDGTIVPRLLPPGLIKRYNMATDIIYLHNGSQIIMQDASNVEKIRSMNLAAAFIDELSELTDDQYLAIFMRCRNPCKLPNVVFSCTNPKTKSHWAYQRFKINARPGSREMITSTMQDKFDIPLSYINSAKELPEPKRSLLLLGEWVDLGDVVFYCFKFGNHVRSIPRNRVYDNFLVCQDFGGGAGFCGMVCIGEKDGVFYVTNEFYKKKTSHFEALEWMEQFRTQARGVCVYDSANAAIATDMENKDWKLIKKISDVEGSITVVNDLLHQDRIVIDESCVELIKQIEAAERTAVRGINKLKGWDLLDAWRYGICAMYLGDVNKYKPQKPIDIPCG